MLGVVGLHSSILVRSFSFWIVCLLVFALQCMGADLSSQSDRAALLIKQGNMVEARQMLADLLARLESSEGSDLERARVLALLGETWVTRREDSLPDSEHTKARSFFLRALEIRERVLGPNHASLIRLLNQIGDTHNKAAEHEVSITYHERALALAELKHGSEHPAIVHQLNRLADTLRNLAKYDDAMALLQRAMDIQLQAHGEKSGETIAALGQLAETCRRRNDSAKAIEYYNRQIDILTHFHGPDHDSIAGIYTIQGSIYTQVSHYAKAKELLERALEIFTKRHGEENGSVATVKALMANLYSAIGDPEKALELDEEVVRIHKKTIGENHPLTAHRMDNLGVRYSALGEHEKAAELHERALKIVEKAYGRFHSSTAHVMGNCADSLLRNGDVDGARRLLSEVLEIRKQLVGPRHPTTAASMLMLAGVYSQSGDHQRALELNTEALRIFEESCPSPQTHMVDALALVSASHKALGNTGDARSFLERSLAMSEVIHGPQHLLTAYKHLELAELLYLEGELAPARSHAARALVAFERHTDESLLTDEWTRLKMLQEIDGTPFLFCLLRPEQIAQTSLRWKGIVLDSLLEDHALTKTFTFDTEAADQLDELKSLRNELARTGYRRGAEPDRDGLVQRIAEIQRDMANRTTVFGRVRSSADLTLDVILPALAGGTTLVDFVEVHDPILEGDACSQYGASVITENGEPVFVRIAGRVEIDIAVEGVHQALRVGDEELLRKHLATLGERLWGPLSSVIPDTTKRLMICPEGMLNFASFAVIPDGEGTFLCEKYPIHYIATPRDLLPAESGGRGKSIAIFANPAFDSSTGTAESAPLVMRSAEVSAFGKVRLPPLPGALQESDSLAGAASENGWSAHLFTGTDASEINLRSLEQAEILHLATHGFYLQRKEHPGAGTRAIHLEGKEERLDPVVASDGTLNPMRASGIALAGAQSTFNSWQNGTAPNPENDGILTAEEVAGLNLENTWLVTLSACETGIGEAKSGEGVFGLRRAFVQAGARNLLVTLWPVQDSSTAGFMRDFYAKCLAEGRPSDALSETQRRWLVSLRETQGLLAAVRDAGAFVLSSHRAGAVSQ